MAGRSRNSIAQTEVPGGRAPQAPIHVVLVGLMGSGKTTVGTALAGRLGWPFRDSDAEIEQAEGRTVREVQAAFGVGRVHALEAGHLLAALASDPPSVIGAAASVIDDAGCRAALVDPGLVVVWLRARPEVLAGRFGGAGHRPSFGDEPVEFLKPQAARRDGLFAELDPLVIDTGTTPVQAAIDRILAVLRERADRPGR